MAKVFTYIMITTGIILLLNLAGLQTAGSIVTEQLSGEIDSIQNIMGNALLNSLLTLAIGALVGAAAIAIGTFGRVNPAIYVTALYAAPLVSLVADMIAIVVLGGTAWTGYLIFLIMTPLIYGYAIALYDWVRGID